MLMQTLDLEVVATQKIWDRFALQISKVFSREKRKKRIPIPPYNSWYLLSLCRELIWWRKWFVILACSTTQFSKYFLDKFLNFFILIILWFILLLDLICHMHVNTFHILGNNNNNSMRNFKSKLRCVMHKLG